MKKEKPKQEVNAVSDLKTFGFVGFNKKRSKEETEQLFGWQKKINQKPKKDFLVAVDKNCGTGSGGFQAGNTCATGTQPSVTDVASFGTRKTAPSESIQRISAIIDHLTKTPEAELRDEIEKIFTNCGFNDGEKRAFGGQDRTPLVMANYFMKSMEETIKDVENLPQDGAVINSEVIKSGALGFIAGMALYSEINGESMLGFVSKDEQEQPFRYSFESSKNAPFIGVFSTRSPNEPFNSGWYAYISLNTFGIYKSMKIDDRFSGTSASAVQSEKIASGAEQTTHMSYLLAAMAQNPNTKNSVMEFDSVKLNGGISMSLEKTAALFSAHVAIHEIAHAAHFSKLLKESKGQFAKADFKMKEMARSPITIGDKLSKNTNSSQTEFVADIFAGLALGATYSDDVYKKYKELSAPTRKIPTDKNIRNKFNFIQNVLKNCGTGSGGFQAGNNCAVGQSVDSVPSLADLKIVRGLGGTTGATLAVDSGGGKWVVKYGATAGQIRSESAANDMYRAAGVLVPLNRLDESNAQEPAQITKFVDGNKLGYPNAQDFEKNAISVSKNFAMDALLANWDAIGMENGENIVVGSNGSVTRIDNGGSLKYRAQGGVKIFGAQVGELETMRTSTQGEAVFGRLSDSDVAKQINTLLTKRVKIIDAAPKELRIVISDRMDYMERWASKISTKKTSFGFLVSVLKNCGTGAGGFQAGNTCGTSGGKEPDYKELELKLGVPANLLREGVMDVGGFIGVQMLFDGKSVKNDREQEYFEVGKFVNYRYKYKGANDKEFELGIQVRTTRDDWLWMPNGVTTPNPLSGNTAAEISFTVNGEHKGKIIEGKVDPNLLGQGTKIISIVQATINHFIKLAPTVKNFTFSGEGVGRGGKARQLLYRRLANKIAEKNNGKVEEFSKDVTVSNAVNTTTVFYVRGNTKSKALNDNNIIAIFTYTFQPALVDPIEDKAEQEFWGLTSDQGSKSITNRNCGTGAGGFQAGNSCATGGGDSIVSDIKLGENERFINVFPIEPPAESQTKSPMEDYENQADFMRHEYVYYGGKVPSTLDNATTGGLGDAIACYVGTDYNKIIVAGLTVDENGNVPIRLVRRYPTSLTDMETDYAIGSAGVGDEHDQRMLVIASSIDGNRDHIGGYGESKNTFQKVMNKSGLIQHDELEESTFQETLKEVGTVGSLTKTDPSQFVVFVGSTHGNEKGELFMQDKQWDSYVNNRERIYAQSYANTLAKLHGNLSTEIEKCGLSPLGQRQSLYRGSSIPTDSVEAVIGKMVKDGVSTKSITSWSKDTTVAMNFTENGKGLVPVIFVSTKVKSGFDVNYGNQRRISSNLADAEHEIILPPQNLKVTKVERVLKGSDVVGVVIHTEPSKATPKKSLKNCGTGSGGFQAGNTCATGGNNSNQGLSVEFVETVRPMDTHTVREEIKERYQKNSCPENYPCETEFNKNFEDDSLSEKAQALLRAYGDESYSQISNGGRALGYTNDFNDGTLEALGECCLPKDPSRYIDDFVKLIEKDPLKYFPNFATENVFDHDWQQEFYDKATELANVVFNKAANKAHDIINKELQGLEIDTQGNNLYRGFNLDTNEAEEFVKGLKDGVLETETVQSWSKDSDRAMEFAAAGTVQAPVLLIAKGVVRGVDLNQSGWATETHEEEVVLPSNNYKVNKVTVHRNENKKIIGLEIEVNQSE